MSEQKNSVVEKSFDALGTRITIHICLDESHDAAGALRDIEDIQKEYVQTEKIFSRFDEKSELSKLNMQLDTWHDASAPLCEVISHVLDYYTKTQELFDPRIIDALENMGYEKDFKKRNFILKNGGDAPAIMGKLGNFLAVDGSRVKFVSRMDFSGIAKGYITDQIAKLLKERGWKNYFVDSGGDMYFSGSDAGQDAWYVAIEGVDEKKMMLKLSNWATATSGIGRRKWQIGEKKFHHIINPKNPDSFSFDLKSVTVVDPKTEAADVWAKTLFIKGKEEGRKYATEKNIPCVFLDYKGTAWLSPAAKNYLWMAM